MRGTGLGHRFGIDGAEHDRRGCAVGFAVVDGQLGRVIARFVEGQAGADGIRVVELRAAVLRFGRQGPMVGQDIAVDIMGGAAVKHQGVAHLAGLGGAGVCHRFGVLGVDGDGGRGAVKLAVIDDETDLVGSRFVDGQGGMQRGGIDQDRLAAGRFLGQRPLVGDEVAVQVAGGAAVQGDGLTDDGGLIRSGVGHRRPARGLGCPVR